MQYTNFPSFPAASVINYFRRGWNMRIARQLKGTKVRSDQRARGKSLVRGGNSLIRAGVNPICEEQAGWKNS